MHEEPSKAVAKQGTISSSDQNSLAVVEDNRRSRIRVELNGAGDDSAGPEWEFDGEPSNCSVSVNWRKWVEVRESTLERLRVGMMEDQGPQLPATAQGGWVPGYLTTGTRLSISPIVGEASAITLQAKKKYAAGVKRSSL